MGRSSSWGAQHSHVRVRPSLVSTEYFVSHIVNVLLHLIFPFDLLSVFKGFSCEFCVKAGVLLGCSRKGGEIEKIQIYVSMKTEALVSVPHILTGSTTAYMAELLLIINFELFLSYSLTVQYTCIY